MCLALKAPWQQWDVLAALTGILYLATRRLSVLTLIARSYIHFALCYVLV